MEEVSILTISIFFIVIYLYTILCIYFDFLLYDVLQLLHMYSIPSTSIDASVSVSTIDAVVQEACSFNAPHTQVCFAIDKFIIVIPLFFGILKFTMFLCFYRL